MLILDMQIIDNLLNDYNKFLIQAPKKAVAKKPTAKSTKKVEKASNPLYPSTPRSNRVGGDIRPKGRDLSRFVRWPKYVRVQRQKRVSEL